MLSTRHSTLSTYSSHTPLLKDTWHLLMSELNIDKCPVVLPGIEKRNTDYHTLLLYDKEALL